MRMPPGAKDSKEVRVGVRQAAHPYAKELSEVRARVRQATQSPQREVLIAEAITGIAAFLITIRKYAQPPTDRKGWATFCDRVIALTAAVWLLFGLSFMLLPSEMAAQVAMFEGVPSGIELNSVAAATDYRASIGGIQVGAGLYLLTVIATMSKRGPVAQQISRYHAMSLSLFVWAGVVLARGVGLWYDGFSFYNLLALISAEGPLLFVSFAGWLHLEIDDGDDYREDGANGADSQA